MVRPIELEIRTDRLFFEKNLKYLSTINYGEMLKKANLFMCRFSDSMRAKKLNLKGNLIQVIHYGKFIFVHKPMRGRNYINAELSNTLSRNVFAILLTTWMALFSISLLLTIVVRAEPSVERMAGESNFATVHIIVHVGEQRLSNARFVVIVDKNDIYYVETDFAGEIIINLPIGHEVDILGPSMSDSSKIFVPIFISLGRLEREYYALLLELTPGAIVRVITIPAVENNMLAKLRLEVNSLTYWDPRWINIYGDLSPLPLYLLNITGDMSVVPSNTPLKIEVKSDLLDWPIVIDDNGEPLILERNEIKFVEKFAHHILLRNLRVVQKEYEKSLNKIGRAKEYGLYVGMEKERLKHVNETMKKVLLHLMGVEDMDIFQAAYYLKYSYEECLNIQNNVDALIKGSATSFLPIILLSFMTSIGICSLCFEEKLKYFIFSLILFAIIFVILYYSYPGFRLAGINDYTFAGYSIAVIYLLLFLISESGKDLKTVGGVSLVSAILVSLSLALRNMKRRKIRTVLIFMSLIIMVLGLTLLSSITFSSSIREIKTVSPPLHETDNLIVISRMNEVLDYRDITWITLQPESKLIALKAQTTPQNKPLGHIKSTFQVNGIIGITANDPNLKMLQLAITPEDLNRVLETYASALISEEVAKNAGIEYGDEIVISSKKIRVVGFFNPEKISQFRDVDGDFWCPKKITQLGEIVYCSGNEIIITNFETSITLGALVTRCYMHSEDFQSAINLARRLSLLTSYFVIVSSSDGTKYIYFPFMTISVSGFTLLIPLILVSLNIFATIISSVYERKGEISILSVIGLNPLHIMCIFVLESLVLGFLAGSIGYFSGIISFKVLEVFGVYIPINAKTSILDVSVILGTTILVTTLSYLIPSLKASTLVTPSLSRKWKTEAVSHKGRWFQEIPARIPPEKIHSLINYICEKLPKESDNVEVKIDNLKRETLIENGETIYAVRFRYLKGGDKPFYAKVDLKARKIGDYYRILIECEIYSVYPKFEEIQLREVISLIRKIVLEWSSFRDRIMVPLGKSYDIIISIIRNFTPRSIYIVTRKPSEEVIEEVRNIMRTHNLLPPNIKVETVEEKSIKGIIERINTLLNDVDVIHIDSDDYLLSVALALAVLKSGKKVSYFIKDKVMEERLEDIMP